uniref:Uncharacterized protein n=1 Tax=Helianthus annuus TaxID=4232 RepID=A0A251V0S7_HELAN
MEKGLRTDQQLRQHGGDGDDALGGFLFGSRDDVPWHPDGVLGFQIQKFRHG